MEDPMAHVQDAAAYILHARGPMSAMKLQKLCYYAYGYHLAWESRQLFPVSPLRPPMPQQGKRKKLAKPTPTQVKELPKPRRLSGITGTPDGRHPAWRLSFLDLEELRLDDFDELFRFRLGTMRRLWGIVDDEVFYPVWWDPDHKVYPQDRE
jgi:hypothetical protein